MRRAIVLAVAVILSACPAEMWIPIETAPRPAVSMQHVQYLLDPPTRPFTVIGILTPPTGEYDTEAQAVKALREEAAEHGADAIFIESQTTSEGWRFSAGFGAASGGNFKETTIRAKAIVWRPQP